MKKTCSEPTHSVQGELCEPIIEKKFGRRNFIKLGGLGLAALATTKAVEKISAAEKVLTGRRLAMIIDLRKCYGCHSCQVACKAEFNVPLGGFRSWVKSEEEGKFPNVRRHFLPRLCNHCDNPPCVKICPVKATTIREEDGTVIIDEKRCIGCKNCIAACPYNSRFFNEMKKIAEKCDFCLHRVENGVVPACVNTCPANARTFGDFNDPQSNVSKLLNTQPTLVLKPELGTKPQVYYIISKGMKGIR